jgi:acyl-CoA synthetase (AMP-forming)/AMP-acid ligase II
MRILDDAGREVPPGQVGEICGRGPLLMAGYSKRPDLTARAIVDGWLHWGDLGRVDEDGYLYLVDRKKDMIISGGVNVYPRDIEEIVVEQPGAVSAPALVEWINARVAAKFQRVSDVVIRADLPRSVAGKTLKRALQDAYRARPA